MFLVGAIVCKWKYLSVKRNNPACGGIVVQVHRFWFFRPSYLIKVSK
jgi:hypothetical protein